MLQSIKNIVFIGQGWATHQGRQSPTSQSLTVEHEMEDKMVQKNSVYSLILPSYWYDLFKSNNW